MKHVKLGSKSVSYAAGCIHTICYFTKESLKASSRASVNSANEVSGLQKTIKEEQRLHQEEIKSLKGQLERMTEKLQEKESTLKK